MRKDGVSNILGQLFGEASTKQVDNRNEFADNLRQWKLNNLDAGEAELLKEFRRLRDLGLKKLTIKEDDKIIDEPSKKIPGVPEVSPLDNLEAGFFTESTQEDIDREKALNTEEEEAEINFSNDNRVQSIVKAAKELGISPIPLAAVIAQESSFRPSVVSTDKATGKQYTGLIQFGPYEIQRYKIKPNMTFEEQMVAVTNFLKDRGVQPGHG